MLSEYKIKAVVEILLLVSGKMFYMISNVGLMEKGNFNLNAESIYELDSIRVNF